MIVALEDGTPLRGDFVLQMTQRFDLTPIPSTLEVVIRSDSSASGKLGENTVLRAGPGLDRYRVIKARKAQGAAAQHTGGAVDVVELTAIPEQFVGLAKPLPRAVVKVAKGLGEVYRSCGATCRVGADVPVPRFTCLAGDYPTPHIARVMHEEGVVPVLASDGRLSFRRYRELFDPRPVSLLTDDATQVVESGFLERHEVPTAYSLDASGNIITGNTDHARRKVFVPRSSARVLQGMTRCLMVRRTTAGAYAGEVRAGDVVEVSGSKHVVVTAAHRVENGNSGIASQTTRLWLGQLEG